MKNVKKNHKFTKLLGTLMAAAMILTMTAPIGVSAKESATAYDCNMTVEESSYPETSYSTNYYERAQKFYELQNTTKTVYIRHEGGYHAKDVKLYGRKIVKVEKDGSFVLGEWEELYTNTGIHGGGFTPMFYFDINAAYVSFAFSYDITWGTDYPYSGVFWDDIYNTDWEGIHIHLSGTCRMADIKIIIDDETVVDETNCSAHKEWRP